MKFRSIITAMLALALVAVPVFGQGTTSVLTGTVTSEGAPMPGVSVTVSSPALQGTRTSVTNENGAYVFPALPPGPYTVVFELDGMQTVSKKANLNLAQTSRVDANLKLSGVAEAITVTATAPTALETTEVSTNFSAKTIENLPTGRTVTAAAALAPGVSTEGPNDQLMISGAPSYENLYLVNGAVVNDTVRGQPESVYIEDAIQETTILTGMVSAEYGRFTGGVVSAITKSGGNEFSGSIRDSLTNDDWTNKTPFAGEADKTDEINHVYEATLGGYVLRDRLWFFGAGRLRETEASRETRETNIPYAHVIDEQRWEAKLTGQITQKHSLVASYLDRLTKETNNSFGSITDTRSLDDRELPNSLLAVSYSGVLTDRLLLEAQYSQREFAFVGSGANSTDIIEGTIIRDRARGYRAWSPTFCGICGDKERDNEYIQLKSSYFLSSPSFGNHNIVAGIEDFSEQRDENNEQGGSGFRVWGDFIFHNGETFLRVEPGVNGSRSSIQYWPVLNRSLRSDSSTQSIYVNDKWDLNDRWTFNLGARYDRNDAIDQSGAKVSDDSAFSPRLGAVYDLLGDGRHRVSLGFNRYVSKIDNGVNDSSSNAGSPAYFEWNYAGPAINTVGTPVTQLVPTAEVLRQVFAWFETIGGINNTNQLFGVSLPGVNVKLDGQLSSPKMDEYSLGYGLQIGGRGYLRADYIFREWSDFYVDITNLATGTVTNDLGQKFDLTLVGNDDTGISREYNGIQLQGSYRILDRLNFGGNYTWSTLKGNADSETSNNATITITSAASYPEYLDMSWNNPDRYLSGDVRHRANLWLTYDLPTSFGNFNVSLLESFHTGYPYYAVGSIDLRDITNPGYQRPPSNAGYFVEGTKEYRTDDVTRTDIGLNYSLPIFGIELFAQADILNLFDEDAIEDPSSVRTTVYTSRSSACVKADGKRCDRFNPKTQTPVEGVHYVKHADFGKAASAGAYQLPLTYRFSLGLRF